MRKTERRRDRERQWTWADTRSAFMDNDRLGLNKNPQYQTKQTGKIKSNDGRGDGGM